MNDTFKTGDVIVNKDSNMKYTIWHEDDFWYCLRADDYASSIRIPKQGAMEKWSKVG